MKPDFKPRHGSSAWHDFLSIPLLVAAMLLYGPVATAADAGSDKAYLNGLEDEAKTLKRAKGSAGAGQSLALSEQAPADPASVKKFERRLRKEFAGSYQFYSKLETGDKLKAYEEYEENQDLSAVSDKILKLFFAHARRSQ